MYWHIVTCSVNDSCWVLLINLESEKAINVGSKVQVFTLTSMYS